jgi:hypothetical protein
VALGEITGRIIDALIIYGKLVVANDIKVITDVILYAMSFVTAILYALIFPLRIQSQTVKSLTP